jgi:hypothetical protein
MVILRIDMWYLVTLAPAVDELTLAVAHQRLKVLPLAAVPIFSSFSDY